MSYTYVNGIYEVTTKIHDGYKRFNHRNAQYRYTYDTRYEQWDFVSYAYPVMSVYHIIENDSWECIVGNDAFDCSRTTTRQIGDFLKYIGCPINWRDIRMTIKGGYSSMYLGKTCDNSIHVRGEVNSLFDIRF